MLHRAILRIAKKISRIIPSARTSHKHLPNINIKNFGQVDARFYRGAQPKRNAYSSLLALGIRTIINLRDDPVENEKSLVEKLGMKYINIPISDKTYPELADVEAFLQIIDHPLTGIFFVHCAGGRHRTGVMGAVYRFRKYDWSFEEIYEEMKVYDFYTRWGHGPLKDFVVNYTKR